MHRKNGGPDSDFNLKSSKKNANVKSRQTAKMTNTSFFLMLATQMLLIFIVT